MEIERAGALFYFTLGITESDRKNGRGFVSLKEYTFYYFCARGYYGFKSHILKRTFAI